MKEKSKVIVLPCEEYDEEIIYALLKAGLDQLGRLDQLIGKEEKILLQFYSGSDQSPPSGSKTIEDREGASSIPYAAAASNCDHQHSMCHPDDRHPVSRPDLGTAQYRF